jgi:broad specificity phosphatase PhoE
MIKALLIAVSLILVRHAEKANDSKDTPISAVGQARAQALANKLRDAGITAIYATDLQRTQQTAKPLADELKLKMNVRPANATAALIEELRKQDGVVLVVGHSNTLPAIAQAFGAPIVLGDDEYDALFIVSGGKQFKLHQ